MVKCELSNESKLEALNYLRDSKGNSAAISYVSSKDEDLELLQAADIGVGFDALTEYGLIGAASVLLMGNKIFQIPQALFRAKRISVAALLSAAVMLGLELLLLVLGLLGGVSVWVAMLLVLLARVGTLVYSIYFK
jgi:cation transport ATPase